MVALEKSCSAHSIGAKRYGVVHQFQLFDCFLDNFIYVAWLVIQWQAALIRRFELIEKLINRIDKRHLSRSGNSMHELVTRMAGCIDSVF